jgi:hypothetical protein
MQASRTSPAKRFEAKKVRRPRLALHLQLIIVFYGATSSVSIGQTAKVWRAKMTANLQIPRKLHLIWVGKDYVMPRDSIESWRRRHPGWSFKLWTDHDLHSERWVNEQHIRTFSRMKKWPAVADLMRYEILYREGGVYVDADALCLRTLDEWLLENEMFACWVDTFAKRKLVNNAFMGTVARNPFLAYVIEQAAQKRDVLQRWSWSRLSFVKMGAWRSVGPYHLTSCINSYRNSGYSNITVLPSHIFSPVHFRGRTYGGNGVVYANHGWATTLSRYEPFVQAAMPQSGEGAFEAAEDQRVPAL